MSTEALVTMLLAQISILSLTLYFYRKVLKAPKKQEPDSYADNDED